MDNQYFMGSQNFSSRLDELDARLIQRDEIVRFLASGQKINAIKIYRADTGASLADAKAAVERMEQTIQLNGPSAAYFSNPQAEISVSGAYALGGVAGLDGVRSEVEELLRQRRQIEAIKLYRERTGVGLREAKNEIEQIDRNLRAQGSLAASSPPGWQDTPAVPSGEVRRYLLDGYKIKAIKAYREQTGLSLKDAKDEIDRLERALRSGLE